MKKHFYFHSQGGVRLTNAVIFERHAVSSAQQNDIVMAGIMFRRQRGEACTEDALVGHDIDISPVEEADASLGLTCPLGNNLRPPQISADIIAPPIEPGERELGGGRNLWIGLQLGETIG